MRVLTTCQINRTKIIFEQFEDETFLIDTQIGCYSSLSPSRAKILHFLEIGCALEDLLTGVRAGLQTV